MIDTLEIVFNVTKDMQSQNKETRAHTMGKRISVPTVMLIVPVSIVSVVSIVCLHEDMQSFRIHYLQQELGLMLITGSVLARWGSRDSLHAPRYHMRMRTARSETVLKLAP
jgi:uncharacterized membrane protein